METKTTTLCAPASNWERKKAIKTANRCFTGTLTKCWRNVDGIVKVSSVSPTLTTWGRSVKWLSRSTPLVMVADTRTRLTWAKDAPHLDSCCSSCTIYLMLFSNPKSSRRSASSMIMVCKDDTTKEVVVLRWSSSRPGVVMSTGIPFRNRAFYLCRFSPPWSPPTVRNGADRSSTVNVFVTWSTNYLVGHMTMTSVPMPRCSGVWSHSWSTWCSVGNAYANVFPLPVSLRRSTSQVRSAIACQLSCWMRVN